MRRLLIFITVLYVIWRVLIIIGSKLQKRAVASNPFGDFFRHGSTGGKDHEAGGEPLVACSYCGTLLPASRALHGPHGAVFCSESCRQLAQHAGSGEHDAPQ